MKQFFVAYWSLIIDVIVIVSCALMVLFFIKNKNKEEDLIGEEGINLYLQKTYKKKDIFSAGDFSNFERYGEVSQLARLGLTIKEISKKLRIPQGEVELVLTSRK
jgi:hypothetical protein